jgi:transposase-like protein
MSYATAELLGRVERRRRFSVEQKLAVLAEAMAPGANISAVARRHGMLPAQVYKWRRLAELGVIGVPGASELPSFVAIEITKDVPSLPAPVVEDKSAAADDAPRRRQRKKAGLIEIELAFTRDCRPTCIGSVFGRVAKTHDHDAVMRISGEAPGQREVSVERQKPGTSAVHRHLGSRSDTYLSLENADFASF